MLGGPTRLWRPSEGTGPLSPRRLPACAVTVLAAAGTIALSGSPVALAARAHGFSVAFGSAGAGAGQLSLRPSTGRVPSGSGVAVRDATRPVFVADTRDLRVDEVDPSQTPSETFRPA